MIDYAILLHPSHGRAYLDNAGNMALAEFNAVMRSAGGLGGAELRAVGGVPCVVFSSAGTPGPEALANLAWLSFRQALFELGRCGERTALFPVEGPEIQYFPESLGSILKYAGKTNDRFTRLMVNLALSARGADAGGVVRLLDPMCGKGTTLWEGWMRGFDAAGVEINRAWWQEAGTYAVRYLETGRYKHSVSRETVPGERGRKLADVLSVQTARDKQAFDAGDVRALRLVHGDSLYTPRYFKKASFDLLAADLPYGVQHAGKRAGGAGPSAEGDLRALLSALLPGWRAVLKPGGAAALAYNVHTLAREDAEALLEQNGFTVMRGAPWDGFLHRVDQGIRRDVSVAVKDAQ